MCQVNIMSSQHSTHLPSSPQYSEPPNHLSKWSGRSTMERHDHHHHSYGPESSPPTGAGDTHRPQQPQQQRHRCLQQSSLVPTGSQYISPSYLSREGKVSLEKGEETKKLGGGKGGRKGGREGGRERVARHDKQAGWGVLITYASESLHF